MRGQSAIFGCLAFLAFVLNLQADGIPKGFVVPECTISPDGRYGVTVPLIDQDERLGDPKNSVIDLTTGKVITVIKSQFTGWNRQNHGGVLPCQWSRDGSLLLWEVEGKWFSQALVLLKFKNGVLEWQRDILGSAQAEMLARTKSAAPEQYAKAKAANAGNGAAYPEGFSIAVAAVGQVSLPLRIQAALTSDPKQIGGFPRLGSQLTGLVDTHGEFKVTDFELRDNAFERFEAGAKHREVCPRDAAAEEKSRSQDG
jgi:hypothetical protein